MTARSPRVGDRAPSGGAYDEAGDATRRTLLAVERTYLAWWRTGLTSMAVALGVGKVAPAVSSGAAWPYELVGVAFCVLGLGFIGYGQLRVREAQAAVRRGEYAYTDPRVVAAFGLLGVLLVLGTLALIVVGQR